TIDKHGHWGRLYLNARFFDAAIDRFRDRLAWVVARDPSGAIVAGAFNVVRGRYLYGRYWGTRAEVPFLHFEVCYYAGVRHCIERGIDVFEPGAGGEHKRARGFVPTLTHSAHWLADRRLRSALAPPGARANASAWRRSWRREETTTIRVDARRRCGCPRPGSSGACLNRDTGHRPLT